MVKMFLICVMMLACTGSEIPLLEGDEAVFCASCENPVKNGEIVVFGKDNKLRCEMCHQKMEFEKEMLSRFKLITEKMLDARAQIINDSGNAKECGLRTRLKFAELKRQTNKSLLTRRQKEVEEKLEKLEDLFVRSFSEHFNQTLQESILNFKVEVGKKCKDAMIEIVKTDGKNNFEKTLRDKAREFANEFRKGKEFFEEVFEAQLKELIDEQIHNFHSKNLSGNAEVEKLEGANISIVDASLMSEHDNKAKPTTQQVVVENLSDSQVCESCKKIHPTKQDLEYDQSQNKSTDVTSEEVIAHSKELSPENLILSEEDLNVSEKELINSGKSEAHSNSNVQHSHNSSNPTCTLKDCPVHNSRPYNSNNYSNQAGYHSSRHDSSRTIIFYSMIGVLVFGCLILYSMKSCSRRNAAARNVPQKSTGSPAIIVADATDTIHMVRV